MTHLDFFSSQVKFIGQSTETLGRTMFLNYANIDFLSGSYCDTCT